MTEGSEGGPGSRAAYAGAREVWHNVPVDDLFPPRLSGKGAGPGDADRTWTRVVVAPDAGCARAFDPLLAKALSPVGCERLLRATYTDATETSVITAGILVTKADQDGMRALRGRFTSEGLSTRGDLMPLPYAAGGTPAEDFGARQRASWSIDILTDAPAVVFAVSGFADGRPVAAPQAADEATRPGATTTPALSGLGHDAKGVADRVESAFRTAARKATERPG